MHGSGLTQDKYRGTRLPHDCRDPLNLPTRFVAIAFASLWSAPAAVKISRTKVVMPSAIT